MACCWSSSNYHLFFPLTTGLSITLSSLTFLEMWGLLCILFTSLPFWSSFPSVEACQSWFSKGLWYIWVGYCLLDPFPSIVRSLFGPHVLSFYLTSCTIIQCCPNSISIDHGYAWDRKCRCYSFTVAVLERIKLNGYLRFSSTCKVHSTHVVETDTPNMAYGCDGTGLTLYSSGAVF